MLKWWLKQKDWDSEGRSVGKVTRKGKKRNRSAVETILEELEK